MTLLVLALVVLSTLQLSTALPPQNSGLELSTLTKSVVAGTYTELATGKGINFVTRNDGSIHISTLESRLIINVDVSANDGVVRSRLIELEGENFLQEEDETGEHEYHLDHDTAMKIKLEHEGKQQLVRETLNKINTEDETQHKSAIQDSILTLLNDTYLSLIVDAVMIMGERGGLTGKEYPALLPLYMMAARLEAIAESSEEEETVMSYDDDDEHDRIQKRATCNCWYTCPPCTNINCLGMCGKKCSCWSWVCGDCCFHSGCYQHDLDCANYGYWSFKCIFGALTVIFNC